MKSRKEKLLSAYRRDSRMPLGDEATNSNDQRGFPCTESVYHGRDYTSDLSGDDELEDAQEQHCQ